MTRLTTIARTGRLTNRSVSFIGLSFYRPQAGAPSSVGTWLPLAVLGPWSWAIAGLHLVVDLDWSSVTKSEHSGTDDLVAGFEAGGNCDLIATRTFDLDHLLTDTAVGMPLPIGHVGHDVNRVAVRGIVDGRRRKRHYLARRTQRQVDANKHSGPQLAARIGESRLHLDVARLLIDNRVNRIDAAGELGAVQIITADPYGPADSNLRRFLLRYAEVHINRIERLQRYDRLPGGKILAEVDLANTEHP